MNTYQIAIYLRLSKENRSVQVESNSISQQRYLLIKYAAEHFTNYKLVEFCDDGYTGTNFKRPGIQKMLALAKESKIGCIIVKDFSRFARDYIELGDYLEHIFPFLKIRFISINDCYDSESLQGKGADLGIHFKNLLYDLYSKDISQKVRSALAIRKKQGVYISANAPFGYEKPVNDRHMLIIEEDEAEVVRDIFRLSLNGYTSAQIAREFNQNGIKTPIDFKIRKGKTSRTPKGERFLWNCATVCQILRNPVYVGDIAYNKYTKPFVGGKTQLKPREEWKIHSNHHCPIIARELFDQVQCGSRRKRVSNQRQAHVLIGKIECGGCGRNLRYRSGRNPYFTCVKRYLDEAPECVRKVNVLFLEEYLLFQMQEHLYVGQDKKCAALTVETIEQYIAKIVVFLEQDIKIEWKSTFA
jgi:DNA invertase Pin-like site-specific DNA recombinase